VGTVLGDRPVVIIDEDTVGAGVLEDVHPIAKVNARVVRRDEALGIGQHPVVVGGAANIAARTAEYHRTAVSEQPAMITYYSKL
jgi:hypothetical protein